VPEQRFQPGGIIERNQLQADHVRHKGPELILPIPIVFLKNERLLAWQASQHKQVGMVIDYRIETALPGA
jgi:hypothetical protein